MSDQDSLKDALDGLIDAVEYAEDIGEHELAREISALYQKVGRKSPDEHWDPVYKCRVTGREVHNAVEEVEEAMILEDQDGDTIEVHATSDAISELENKENISDVEVLEEPDSN